MNGLFTYIYNIYIYICVCVCVCVCTGYAMSKLVEALRYNLEGRQFDSRWRHWLLSFTQSFCPHSGTEVHSASNRNKYQEYFLGVKAAGVYGWQTYHLHVFIVLKLRSHNLLNPSGPVQGYAGIALPVYIYIYIYIYIKVKCSRYRPGVA